MKIPYLASSGTVAWREAPAVWRGAAASTQAECDAVVPELLREELRVEQWRCKRCRTVKGRDGWATRRGLLECGACLHSSALVDQLEPITPVRYLHLTPVERISLVLRGLPGWDEDWKYDVLAGKEWASRYDDSKPSSPRLDWLIVSGQTGPDARPLHPAWVSELRDAAVSAGVPFFFAGFGDYEAWTGAQSPSPSYRLWNSPGCPPFVRVGAARSGRLLDGREWVQMPEEATT